MTLVVYEWPWPETSALLAFNIEVAITDIATFSFFVLWPQNWKVQTVQWAEPVFI